jgi:beta-glucosidase
MIHSTSFDQNFFWGVATSSLQNEGAAFHDGKGASIWDEFSNKRGKIFENHSPENATEFYFKYKEDIDIACKLGFNSFRFSFSWSRLIPDGTGKVNPYAVNFYKSMIDYCLEKNLFPLATLYHWDLPLELEKKGGWCNPSILNWFKRYAKICANLFGDKVKHWLVLNEPLSFTALGYMIGLHAPGKRGTKYFIPAVQNACIAQAEGGRVLRENIANAKIGTSFSCSEVIAASEKKEDFEAAKRVNQLMNHLFIQPLLGNGFPSCENFELLKRLEIENRSWRFRNRMSFDFDFIGLQNYFPIVVKHQPFVPHIQAIEVKAKSRMVPHTDLGWEINPNSFYNIIRDMSGLFPGKQIFITENGACFKDKLIDGNIMDIQRCNFFESHLIALKRLVDDGIPLNGYYVWALTDNFEWHHGYNARFGLVYINYNNKQRILKQSAYWWKDFLNS